MNVVTEHNSGARRTTICRECGAPKATLAKLKKHMTDEHDTEAEVESGEIYARSPLTGAYYRVEEWVRYDDGRIQSREKTEVDRSEVPDEWLEHLEDDANAGEHT